MTDTAILLATGPCLITAMGAMALFIVGVSLGSGTYALLWALAFTASTLQWILIVSSSPAAWPTVSPIASLLGLGSVVFLAQGFRVRRKPRKRSDMFALAVLLAFVLHLATAALPAEDPLRIVLPSLLKAVFFLWGISNIFTSRHAVSPSEWAVAAMLLGVVLLTAAIGLGDSRSPDLGWLDRPAAAILAGPVSAATALFVLLLIASDFAAERRRLVHTDPLTGVLNRLGFGRIARAAARRRKPMSIVVADIDWFKAINDRYGHTAGDAVLASFADRLGRGLRPGEAAGRIGGEEFALLLADHGTVAFARVEQVRDAVATLAIEEVPELRVTASFGVAEQARGEALSSVFGRADEALYGSKRNGRNRSTLASPVEA